ncbi:SurA N-terminal domain-containing protein [Orrella sp. JC864]|uniref:SurA N-terminal domain-containing protein n=1 Tax=Orrella sp. JC864 TaxID=3120298 RepID=UPI0012BC84E3
MFDIIRNNRRVAMFLLLLLVVPSFVFFGMEGYMSFNSRDTELASVRGEPITQQEFDRVRAQQLEQYRAMLGSQFDASALDTPELRRRLLDQMIDTRVVANAAAEGRYSVSDETLRRTIAGIPQVQEDGRFSPERYRQALAAQGLTPAGFEAGLRRDLATAQVLQPVAESAGVPDTVLASLQAALTETRTLRLRRFEAAQYRDGVQVSQADIQAWYDAHAQSLEVPEHVRAQYVVIDEAAASQGIEIGDADIAGYYEQNKSRFGTPERRRAAHILIESGGDAQAARGRAEELARQAAADPGRFAELAREHSQDPGSAASGGDLGWISPGMLVEPVEKAIYGLKDKDQVSGVVQSQFGFHVVKLTDLQPADIKPLDEVREQIRDEIRKQLASERFADMSTKLTQLVYDQRDSLQPVADSVGVQVRSAGGITRTGLLDAGQAGPDAAAAGPDAELLDNPRVREALFSAEVLGQKLNSGVIEVSPGVLVAVRVAEVTPAQVPALEQVSAQVRERLLAERAAQAAHDAGQAALKTLEQAPASDSAPEGFGEPHSVSRQTAEGLPREVLEAVMRAPHETLPAYVGTAQGSDYVIARIEAVEPGKPSEEQAQSLRAQLARIWGEAEQEAVLRMMRQQFDTRVLPAAEAAIQGERSE